MCQKLSHKKVSEELIMKKLTALFLIFILMVTAYAPCAFATEADAVEISETIEISEITEDVSAVDETETSAEDLKVQPNPNGKVRHLIVPVVVLIVSCILGMIYSGYFYDWDTYTCLSNETNYTSTDKLYLLSTNIIYYDRLFVKGYYTFLIEKVNNLFKMLNDTISCAICFFCHYFVLLILNFF